MKLCDINPWGMDKCPMCNSFNVGVKIRGKAKKLSNAILRKSSEIKIKLPQSAVLSS